jgi:hypothetical protein
MEQQASRLSMCLGAAGRISDAKLSHALLNFMKEGARFAFEGNSAEEDDLVLGSRLPFLLVLTKYSTWIKKNKLQLEELKTHLLQKETVLRTHPDFDEVHEDDLAAVRAFKESLGIRETKTRFSESTYTQDDDSVAEDQPIATPSPAAASASSRRRISTASSQRSRLSTQSNLSPLYEEEGVADSEEDRDVSPSPQKRRRLVREQSLGSRAKVRGKIDEETEEEGSDSDSN